MNITLVQAEYKPFETIFCPQCEGKDVPPSGQTLRNDLVLLLRCISDARRQLGGLDHQALLHQRSLLARSRDASGRFGP